MAYDVFICYRHDRPNEKDGNVKTAELIQLKLEKLFPGWSVCLDMNVCKDGRFYNKTFPAIQSCRNFVVMLTDGSLDRCKNEDDWVRREILEAFINPCKVILISPDGEMKKLPEDIPDVLSALKDVEITSLGVSEKSFDEQIKTLVRDRFVSGGREADLPKGKVLHIETDYDCLVKLNGEELIHATVDGKNSTVLPEGRHKMKFVAEGYDGIFEEEVVDTDKLRPHDFIEVKLKDRVSKYKDENDEEFEVCRVDFKDMVTKHNNENDKIFRVGGVKFRMVKVEGGRFEMGATAEQGNDACSDEKPPHMVELDDYYIGETVVTQELWMAVMKKEPTENGGWTDERGRGADYPAYNVSYGDIVNGFLPELKKRLKEETGIDYDFRLPTEAQWEYAARGGRKNEWKKYSGGTIYEVAWYEGNSGGKIHPVKGKKANELELYDMSGNVWEICEDWYGRKYYRESEFFIVSNPKGPDIGPNHVVRGGCWWSPEEGCRVSSRGCASENFNFCGFRLVLCP